MAKITCTLRACYNMIYRVIILFDISRCLFLSSICSPRRKLASIPYKTVEQHPNLLDNIGISQMEQEVRKKVIKLMKDLSYQTEQMTGIQTSP
jgi:hypothetical protein